MKKNSKSLVGKILNSTWGYEQTNVDFYVIVKETAKTLWYVPVDKSSKPNGYGYDVDPDMEQGQKIVDAYQADPKSVDGVLSGRKSFLTGSVSVKVKRTDSRASLWNGRTKFESYVR